MSIKNKSVETHIVSEDSEKKKKVAIIATYYLAFVVNSMFGSPRFLHIQDTNGDKTFKTGCLARDQHCIGE